MSLRNTVPRVAPDNSAVADYKRVLQLVLERRPAGTRRRLAEELGKNRSFVSQITNAKYSVPIPANHIQNIFAVCHFLATEKSSFMDAYRRAHPHRAPDNAEEPRWRELRLRLPDLRDREKNRQLDELIEDTLRKVVRLIAK